MQQKFYSHGKLLISGEYAVLDGALALAVPTRFGQHMSVRENNSGILSWTSLDENGNAWFRELCGIRSKLSLLFGYSAFGCRPVNVHEQIFQRLIY